MDDKNIIVLNEQGKLAMIGGITTKANLEANFAKLRETLNGTNQ